MELWHVRTSLLQDVLASLSIRFGLSEAVAIPVATLVVRMMLIPVSLSATLRMEANSERCKA